MFLRYLAGEEEPRMFLELMHCIATCDDEVLDIDEAAMMHVYRNELKISAEDYGIRSLNIDVVSEFFTAASEMTKRTVLLEALIIALANRHFHPNQQKIIDQLRQSFGISDERYGHLVEWAEDILALLREGEQFIISKLEQEETQ